MLSAAYLQPVLSWTTEQAVHDKSVQNRSVWILLTQKKCKSDVGHSGCNRVEIICVRILLRLSTHQRSTRRGSSGSVQGLVLWIAGLVIQKWVQGSQETIALVTRTLEPLQGTREGKETGLRCTDEGWSHTGERR